MKLNKLFIIILTFCCFFCFVNWKCDSGEKGDLFDAPMGIDQDEIINDLYIDDCMINDEVKSQYELTKNENFKVSCFLANLSEYETEATIHLFLSTDNGNDTTDDVYLSSDKYFIGPKERKKFNYDTMINDEHSGFNYLFILLDPGTNDAGFEDDNDENNSTSFSISLQN